MGIGEMWKHGMPMTRNDVKNHLDNKDVRVERVNSLVLHQTLTKVEDPEQARCRGADTHSQG